MKRLSVLLIALTTIFVSDAFAARVQVVRKTRVDGVPIVAVRGEGFCDSDYFRIRVTNDLTGEAGWYTSKAGNTDWPVKINQEKQTCNFYMQVSNDLLNPGYVVDVRTYSANSLRPTHSFRKTVPCLVEQYDIVFNENTWFESDGVATVVTCNKDDKSVIITTDNGTIKNSDTNYSDTNYGDTTYGDRSAPAQACYANIASQRGANQADLTVSCTYATGLDIRVYDSVTGNLLGVNERFHANNTTARAMRVNRHPYQKAQYRIEMRTNEGELFSDSEVIFKDPTQLYKPIGNYTHGRSLSFLQQSKALGRGYFWKGNISARISDDDVDSSEGRALITAQLIKVVNGSEILVATKSINSGNTVDFSVEHELVKPLLFGDNHTDGQLDKGANTLFIRVWDGYGSPGRSSHIDLNRVTVNVNYSI